MKIKILQKCFTGTGGNMLAGEEHDIDPRIADKLIARGFAQPVKAAKPKAPKKTTRSVGLKKSDVQLDTPEDEI